jgi:hypothetical protein
VRSLRLQGATSLNFFARDHVRAPFDFTLFQAANPLFILVFAPAMAALWPWLDRRAKNPLDAAQVRHRPAAGRAELRRGEPRLWLVERHVPDSGPHCGSAERVLLG